MRHLLLSTIILLISTVSVFSQENDSNESSQSNEQISERESDDKKQEIDLFFNIGAGPAEMRLVDFYTDSIDGINNDTDPILRGIELNLSLAAPKETLLLTSPIITLRFIAPIISPLQTTALIS